MKGRTILFACWMALATLLSFTAKPAFADPPINVYIPLVSGPASTPSGGNAPVIRSFTATPAAIQAGATSTLAWDVAGAASLHIAPGLGAVTGGSRAVAPAATTEYILTASNASGAATARVTVTIVPAGPPPEEAAATWLPFSAAPDGLVHTRGTSVAVDAQGGTHSAYAIRTGLDQGTRPAYYAYCASDCGRPASWERAALDVGEWVSDVRLALDPDGRPRLMIYSSPPNDSTGLGHFTYAACSSQCTNPARWTLTQVAASRLIDTGRWEYVFRYFALDPEGHPVFFYTDGSQGIDHNGTFYATCPASPDSCTNSANWLEVKISPYWLSTPSLAFSPAGQPRAAFFFFDDSDAGVTMRLLYLACDSNCLDGANWQGLSLNDMHGTARFSLRVDAQGRPRLIFFSGAYPDPFFQPNRLYYLACNTNCTLAGQNDWDAHDVGLSAHHGQDADLALDGAGRPRIAYDAFGSGLGFAWCDSACETAGAVWQHTIAESSRTLEDDYPIAPIRRCSISTWVTGEEPILALDRDGNARVGYVAEHGYGGTDLDEPWNTCPTSTDIVLARFMRFPQP